MTAQVVSSAMSQHLFPSAYSSPLATPSPSKENHFPTLSSYNSEASSSSIKEGGRFSESDDVCCRSSTADGSRASESPKARAQRTNEPRSQPRPRLHSLQSLNSGPISPSLTEQDSGRAYISSARSHTSRASLSMSRASSRNAVETLQPLAESSISVGKLKANDASDNTGHNRPAAPRKWSATRGESTTKRSTTSPTLDSSLSEFGQMGAPFNYGERSDVSAKLRNFQSSTGALLRRSHTITSGISSLSQKGAEGTPFHRSPPESAVTFGPRSRREAPKLSQRRQTVSNLSPSPADRLAVETQLKRANTTVSPSPSRTLTYSQPSSSAAAAASTLSVSPAAPSHLRERGTLPNNQLEAKVVILGSQGVGKTSLVHRYTSGQFTVASTPSTIGASFLTKKLIVDGVKVRLQLWDTAGQERFRSMAPMYYRGSHAAVVVYDITSMASFLDTRAWIEELKKNMSTDLVIHVVGAKLDLAWSARQVELEFARTTVRSWLQPYQIQPLLGGSGFGDAEGSPGSPSRPSRLSGFGSQATGSTTRLSAFQRTNSTGRPNNTTIATGGSGTTATTLPATSLNFGSSASSGSASSDAGRRDSDSDYTLSWDVVEVSEVSAKSDRGIEEVFLAVTKKLVERRAQIEHERKKRERNSIFLGANSQDETGRRGEGEAITVDRWTCCG